MSDSAPAPRILALGVDAIESFLTPIAKTFEPSIFAFTEDVEAYEKQGGEIPGARSISATVVALEGFQKSIQDLRDQLIVEAQKEISQMIALSVKLKRQSAVYPDDIPQDIDINADTDLAKQAEAKIVSEISTMLEYPMERIAGLILRAQKLL